MRLRADHHELKGAGRAYIVCKAHDETHRLVLEKLGADRVVIPEQEHAQRLARSMYSTMCWITSSFPRTTEFWKFPPPRAGSASASMSVNVRAKLGVNIIAVENGDKTNVSPAADYRIQEGDVMVVLGDNYALSRVQKL